MISITTIFTRMGENVSDSLRNTVAVVLPLWFGYLDHQDLAIGMAVGALLISLTDLPGSRRVRLISALPTTGLFFGIALLFAACIPYLFLTEQPEVSRTLFTSSLAVIFRNFPFFFQIIAKLGQGEQKG